MPSSGDLPDPVADALNRAARWVCAAVAAVGSPTPVVLIDGRSGSGKSTVAAAIARDWVGEVPVQILALDWLYPGWDGLAAASRMLDEDILRPRLAGRAGHWHRWDWVNGCPAERHRIDPATPLIVEGAGAITALTSRAAHVRVWLEAPPASRHARAMARDGEGYRPHWERWAAQEAVHVRDEQPVRWATHVFTVP